MAKANATIVVTQDEEGNIVFSVRDAGAVTFDYAKAHEDCRAYAEFHGWKQRISDAAALPCDTVTGQPANPADKLTAMRALVAYYESGAADWSRAGTGEGGGRSLTIEAIAKVKGYDYDGAEKMVAAFAAKSYAGDMKKALAFLRTGERVMAAMDEIRKARMGAPRIDADTTLDELVAVQAE